MSSCRSYQNFSLLVKRKLDYSMAFNTNNLELTLRLTPSLQDLLTSVLHVVTREAGRKICRVFRELIVSLVMENEALKHKVGHLESELKSKVEKPQTVYKIKSSGESRLTEQITSLFMETMKRFKFSWINRENCWCKYILRSEGTKGRKSARTQSC